MKTLLLLSFTIMLCSFAGVKTNNSLNEQRFKGRVKSVIVYCLFDAPVKMVSDTTTYLFDERGNETAEKDHTNDRRMDSIFSKNMFYKYDKIGNKIEEDDYKVDGTLSYKFSFAYDNKGNLIEQNQYNNDGALSEKTIFSYNGAGNLTETNRYVKGPLMQKVVYKYDAKANNIEQVSTGPKGESNSLTTLKYNDNNILMELYDDETIGSIDSSFGRTLYEKYDSKGNETEYLEKGFGNQYIQDVKTKDLYFDNTGNLIKWTEVTQHVIRHDTTTSTNTFKREISYY